MDACVQYKETCRLLHDALTKIKAGDSNIENIENSMFYFSQLKKYNNKAQSQCKRVRDNTHQLKKKLDSTDLNLKNLQFEEIYLQREIKKCLNFRSVDEELSLIPEAEYLKSSGQQIADPHLRMVQRLKWELEQRKLMRVDLENWQKKKTTLEEEIGALNTYLTSLLPQLDELLNSTASVQECVGLKLLHRRTQADMASWLPPQLYNVYSQVTGYSEFHATGAVVTVIGDLERAKHLSSADNSDTEEIIPEQETRKRRSAANEPGRKKVFKTHPLTIEVVVPCDDGVHAKVLFSYLVRLRVVTVGISLMITTASPWRDKFSVGTDYMSSKELLCGLWPKDHGEECPNPDTPELFNKYGLPSKSKIPNSSGRPFLWAQRLAGVTGWHPDAPLDVKLSKETVAPFLAAIKQRCLARLALKYQLRNLSATKTVKEGAISQPTLLTELSSWKELQQESLPEFFSSRARQHLSDKDSFYEVSVKRGKTTCKAVLALPLEYPISPPFVLLEVTCPSGKATSRTDANVRAIEAELNVHIGELYETGVEYVLTRIVSKLCLCVDVYVEGLGLEPQIKFFINKFKGPDNVLPYVFNSERQYFEHR